MTLDEQKSILTIALYAAFADDAKDDREREEIRRMAESLAEESDQPDLSRLYQDVLLRRVTIDDATTRLTDSATRQLAYEMSVCVCDADGLQSAPERKFLAELKTLLQLDPSHTDAFDQEVEAIVQLSEATTKEDPRGSPATGLEHFISQKRGLTDRPICRKPADRKGSGARLR